MTIEKIKNTKSRKPEICVQRMIIANSLREQGLSFQAIGIKLNRHHATVIHLIKKYNELLEVKDSLAIRYSYDAFDYHI